MALIRPEMKREVDAIVESIIYLYTESRRLTKGLAAEYGLTGPQLTVLKILDSLDDLSLSELSERIRAKNSTVTGIVDRMEREGLVLRVRSQEDRRVVHIRLSPRGRQLARTIAVEPMEIFEEALASLPERDASELVRILMNLAERVKRIVDAREPKEET